MKFQKTKRLFSALLALMLVVSMLPSFPTAALAEDVQAASVTVSFAAQDGAFFVEPMTVEVTDGLAEEYGYTVSAADHNGVEITQPTVLDALVAVHKAIYGDAFTPETAQEYLVYSGGWATTVFGRSAGNGIISVNGVQPNDGVVGDYGTYTGYLFDTAQLQDGDEIQYNLIQDSWYLDNYAWFTDGKETAFTGEETVLSLSGYCLVYYGTCDQETIDAMTAPVADANMYGRKTGETEWTLLGTTDGDGNCAVSFAEPGLYEITASGLSEDAESDVPFTAAWKTVYVYDKTSVNVTFSAQNGAYTIEPMEITVEDGLAESYGFDVSVKDHSGEYITAPTVADALVAVHKATYGDAFTPETAQDYMSFGGGYLSTAFENAAWNVTVSVDGITPNDGVLAAWGTYTGYTLDASRLYDGAAVQYNYIQDTDYWADYYSVIEAPANIYAGEDAAFTVKGYSLVYYGCSAKEDIAAATAPMSGADVSYRKAGDSEWTSAGTADENGAVTIAFSEAGDYTVMASGTSNDTPLMAGICTVTVSEKPVTWAGFGGNADNMAVTDAETPTEADYVAAKWITEPLGSMMSGVGAAVIADGAMYFQNDKYLTKLDLETGEILAQTALEKSCSYAPSSVAYGDGQIFVAESGVVEAFDAETLARTWIYTDAAGGQANTNVYYRDGAVYTGFYLTDAEFNKAAANYVCIDSSAGDGAEKQAKWTYAGEAGFYWAGAYANEKYVIFGGEALSGAEQSKVTVLDKETGAFVSEAAVLGNVRSDVSYSAETDRLYFTSDAGMLYEAALDADGVLTITQEIALGGKSSSTPVVHNGKAYVGVCGPAQFGADGHTVKVIDLADGTVNYEVPMEGYPQCTLLLSTAYEEETGRVYLYATSNSANGGVKLIVDSEGQTAAEAYDLYIPEDGMKNYCLASVICDEDGTLYYRNDTGRIFALTVSEKPEVRLGDVDLDGDVDAEDALVTLQAVVKLTELNALQFTAAEVNGDGAVTAEDALYILQYVVKLIDRFPAQES